VNQEPFVHPVVNIIIMAWFAAGRWACINNTDIAKTISDDGTGMLGPNPDPSGSSHTFTSRNASTGRAQAAPFYPRWMTLQLTHVNASSESSILLTATNQEN
jgi:hypothetical protein